MTFASAESALAARWLIWALYAAVAFGLMLLAYVEFKQSRGEEP
jgi:hypothetical protein